ncbi:MAG: hypothetical protein MUF51_06405, partial [Vicinamibacteria bacterium]|nr:hypothetical protein [Vicinamibacteria bacterium]
LKLALTDLLKTRQLGASWPGVELRRAGLATGIAALDEVLGGGFPRGQVSEIYGPPSSGRMGVACAALAQATARGAMCAWVDAHDQLDPRSLAQSGVDLARLLWLRGQGGDLGRVFSATGTLLGSGLFEALALDLTAVAERELRRWPQSVWVRLQRMVESTDCALLVLTARQSVQGARHASLALEGRDARWNAAAGPARLLGGLRIEAAAGLSLSRRRTFVLSAAAPADPRASGAAMM